MKQNIAIVLLLATLSFTYAQTNTFPTTGNVGIGTLTPEAKLEVDGDLKATLGVFTTSLPNGASYSIADGLSINDRAIALSAGSIIGSGPGYVKTRMLNFWDFPSKNVGSNIGATAFFNIVDRNDMDRFRFIGVTGQEGTMVMYDKLQKETFKIFDNGSNKTTLILPKPDSYLGIGTTNPQSKLHIDFGGEPKSILFREESNAVSTMNSMIRFTWYNDTADFGIVRSGSTPIEALAVRFNGAEAARFTPNGNFALKNKLEAKEVKVTTTPTADFVFAENYALPKLEAVEKHIKEKKHLPEIASAKEMEKEGLNIGEFQIKLLQKIEELTLYSIEQSKQIKKLQEENSKLKKQAEKIENLERVLLELTSKKQ